MNGLLNIYKEAGFTSFDVVAKLRGILHERKIGHTGTLDPMATGVLPICIGSGTKLCEMLTDHDKVYEAELVLGVTYDTLDVTGEKLSESKVVSSDKEITSVINSFIGGYEQVPPMYSAKKINGKKLYELAREGKEVERQSSFVNIYNIEILNMQTAFIKIRVACGKGTYIRSLIADIGEKLGCGAAMTSLVRTQVGQFDIDKAYTLSQIEEFMKRGEVENYIIPVDKVFSDLKEIVLPESLCRFVENGNFLTEEDFNLIKEFDKSIMQDKENFRIYSSEKKFRAIYEYEKRRNILRPVKMFL